MGYCTRYEFSIHSYGEGNVDKTKIDENVITKILELYNESGNMSKLYPLAEILIEDGIENCTSPRLYIYTGEYKWYDNEDDMKELSKCFPDLVFKLHGDGEEPEDLWDAYYKDGKSCSYSAVIPPFNPKDLK